MKDEDGNCHGQLVASITQNIDPGYACFQEKYCRVSVLLEQL